MQNRLSELLIHVFVCIRTYILYICFMYTYVCACAYMCIDTYIYIINEEVMNLGGKGTRVELEEEEREARVI